MKVDLMHSKWSSREDFLGYSAVFGGNHLQTRNPQPTSIVVKWHGLITPRLKLKWRNMWDRVHIQKERVFIWSIWHKAVAVTSWRARFIDYVNDKCWMCNLDLLETIAHKFWNCKIAHTARTLPWVLLTL